VNAADFEEAIGSIMDETGGKLILPLSVRLLIYKHS
jgi:hypothetical protein